MTSPRRLTGLFALALLTTTAASAGEGVTLRYKLQPGEPQIYETASSMQQKQTVAGQELETSFTMRETTARTLDERTDDGDLKVSSENKRLYFSATIPNAGEYIYDSQKSDRDEGTQLAAELNKVFGRLDGATVQFTMTPHGEVESVTGFQKLLADILQENPIGAQFVGGGTDEAHRLALLERMVAFPEDPVQPGDTWERTLESKLPNLGAVKARRTFKYEGADKVGDRTTARISVATEMTFDLTLEQMGVKVTGTLKTTKGQGTAQFDPDAGRLLSFKTMIELSGELSVEAGGMVIPVQTRQSQTTTTEWREKLSE